MKLGAIVLSTLMCQPVSAQEQPADNETKIIASYGQLTQTFTYSGVSVDVTVDGYSIGGTFPVTDVIGIQAAYTAGNGSLLGFGYDLTQTYFGLEYNLNNDLRLSEGTGSKLSASLGVASGKISTTISGATYSESDSFTMVGLSTEIATSKNMSVLGSLSADINDFNPTYGLGVNIGVGGNSYVQLSYSGSTDKIGAIDVDTSLISIGYQTRF